MNGRHRAALALAFLLAVPVRQAAPQSTAPAAQSIRARNVIVIMGDDHSREVLGAYGNRIVRTPNLDRLAAQGVRFTNAYANSPVCTPSRQSLLTGKLPHAVGVTLLRTPLREEEVTLADHLLERGYATAAVGKMHFNSDLRHGFRYRVDRKDHVARFGSVEPPPGTRVRPVWRPFVDPAPIWLNADALPSAYPDAQSEGTFFAGSAVDFLEENRERPFLLWLSFYEPHSPFNFPPEFAGRYRSADMPLPPVGPDDDRWIPAVFRDMTEAEKRGVVAAYYTSVEYLDRNVGIVLDAVDRLGLAGNTLVVYLGDHGYLLGHHGRFEKHTMWDPAVGAPLLIRAPGLQPGVSDALVEFVDVVPTVLDVLDVEGMAGLQGRSLLPLLEGRTDSHREHVFSEFLADNMAMIRTADWKYVFTSGKADLGMSYETGYGPGGISHRLYHVAEDPHELTNLAGEAGYSGLLRSLQIAMLERFLETHPKADRLPRALSLEDALVWFTEPPDPGGKWTGPSAATKQQ